MEKFFNLDQDKQDTIINAALYTFGKNNYKKAFISDIAEKAGISKALIFHYFGTKKGLYLFLHTFCKEVISKKVSNSLENETDFFKKILLAQKIKMDITRKYPYIYIFLKSVYFETDPVAGELEKSKKMQAGFSSLLKKTDFSKFKERIEPEKVVKLLGWFSDGFANDIAQREDFNIDDICDEFNTYLELLRRNLYKEEYI